ncbi:MAG: type II toxin-antitoxin system RelE/ParE family toxin [Acidobacteriota bacterium]
MTARYRVELRSAAQHDLDRLDSQVRARVLVKLIQLEAEPRPRGVEKLSGHASRYRVRVGGLRVVYEVRTEEVLVLVVRIAGRGQVYRGLGRIR